MSDANDKFAVEPPRVRSSWVRRFRCALRGIAVAVHEESNFLLFAIGAAAAVAGGAWLEISREAWCLVVLSTTLVVLAEMVNCAIEHLSRAVTRERHPEIRDALDIASGAVLVASIGAAGVGLIAIAWPLIMRQS